MSEYVRGHVLFSEGRARLAGEGHMFGKQVRKAIWAESAAASIGEEHLSTVLRRLT